MYQMPVSHILNVFKLTATAHGKSAVDGLGGRFKHAARLERLRRSQYKLVLTS